MNPSRAVAVCIPARRPGTEIERLIRAINADGWPQEQRTIIVVLDGPDAELEGEARRLGAVTVALSQRKGSYAARNAAIDALGPDTEFVLFTDADCIPQPGWTESHVSALRDADLSGGAVEVVLRCQPGPAEFIDSVRHLNQESYAAQGWAATANLAVRRAVAERRFDSSLKSGGDRRFCLDAAEAGYRLTYTPDAVVLHHARRSVRELLAKVWRVANGTPEDYMTARLPSLKPAKWVVSRARRTGVSRGLLWDVGALGVQWLANIVVGYVMLRTRMQKRLFR